MPATIDYELALTSEDLMRRASFSLGAATFQMDATHWNEPLAITVPEGH